MWRGYRQALRSIDLPWIIEIIFPCFYQEHLQAVVQVGKPACHDAARASTAADDNIYFVGDRHLDASQGIPVQRN